MSRLMLTTESGIFGTRLKIIRIFGKTKYSDYGSGHPDTGVEFNIRIQVSEQSPDLGFENKIRIQFSKPGSGARIRTPDRDPGFKI